MFNLLKDFCAAFLGKDPIYYILYVTAFCNARCKMCFYLDEIESADVSQELSLDEIRKISKNSGRLIQLSIGGGEPTLRKDLPDICQVFARNNGVRFITLPTNGINTNQIVDVVSQIIKRCPKTHLRVSLSLDGPEKLHDEIRQVPGNYRNLMETYKQLKALSKDNANLTIDFATVLQSYNQDRIHDLFCMVHKELQPDNHMLMIARGNVRNPEVKQVKATRYKEILELKEDLYHDSENRPLSSFIRAITLRSLDLILREYVQNKWQLNCVAGKKLVIISEKGDVKPCEILDKSFGNLRNFDYDIRKIMRKSEVKETQRWIKDSKCHCTFECATNISVLYDWKSYPNLLKRSLRLFFKSILNS